jgi:hypothetical protein
MLKNIWIFFVPLKKIHYMEAIDTLRAQYGSKQISTVGETTIRFNSFIADESTIISAIYVNRGAGDIDILSELTDAPLIDLIPGVIFRAFTGDIFTKVNLSSGRIVAYLEPNA